MAHVASLGRLLHVLCERSPEEVGYLADENRRVRDGLLSVGMKLHCLGGEDQLQPLIRALGGERCLTHNMFRSQRARFCLVLPPVGNAEAAILLLEAIERYTNSKIFDNADIQLQICSPGRLSHTNAALHAISFYLSSDTIRQYAMTDFETTVSEQVYHRGRRLVIYDAGQFGEFDGEFAWWARTPDGLRIRPALPFFSSRTDLLVGAGSRADIRNINLIATLLVHSQSTGADGYWSSLGSSFRDEMILLLDRHLLSGLLDAPWVHADDWTAVNHSGDQSFFGALQELTAYALDEAHRIRRANDGQGNCGGILAEMQALLRTYRNVLSAAAAVATEELQSRSTRSHSKNRNLILRYVLQLCEVLKTRGSAKDI